MDAASGRNPDKRALENLSRNADAMAELLSKNAEKEVRLSDEDKGEEKKED